MKKRTSILLLAVIFINVISMTSCNPRRLDKVIHRVEQGGNHTGILRQKSVNGTLSDDAESGYEKTKLFLSGLAIPEQTVSEFSDDELDFFARSDSIAAFSNDGLEYNLNMRQIIAMHTNGRMRLYTDIIWSDLPKERYNDIISLNMLPRLLLSYENALLSVSYNGITKQLSPKEDYGIIICDYLGQVGVKFDLGNALEGVKEVDENGVRIHFEIDVFNAAYREYECFNLHLFYQHLHAPYKGNIGGNLSMLGYQYEEKYSMQMTYYELGPGNPLSYFPEGFKKPK